MALLQSRKFKLTAAGILAAVAAGLTGEMAWSQVVWACIAALMANGIGIAIEDAGKKLSGQ